MSISNTHDKIELKLKLLQAEIKKGLVQKSAINSSLFQYNFQRLTIKSLNTITDYIKNQIYIKSQQKSVNLIDNIVSEIQLALKEYRMIFPFAQDDKKSRISSTFSKQNFNQLNDDQQEIDQIQKFMMSRNLNLQLNLRQNQDESYKNQQRKTLNQYLDHVEIRQKHFQSQVRNSNQQRKSFCPSPQNKSKFFLKKNTLDVNCIQELQKKTDKFTSFLNSGKTIQQSSEGEDVHTQTELNLSNVYWEKVKIYCVKSTDLQINLQTYLVEAQMQTQSWQKDNLYKSMRSSTDSAQIVKSKKGSKKLDKPVCKFKVKSNGKQQNKSKNQQVVQTKLTQMPQTPRQQILTICCQIIDERISYLQANQKSTHSNSQKKLYKPITIKDIFFSFQPNSQLINKTGSTHKKPNNFQHDRKNNQNKFTSSQTLAVAVDNEKGQKKNRFNQSDQIFTKTVRRDKKQNTFNGSSQYNPNKRIIFGNSYQRNETTSNKSSTYLYKVDTKQQQQCKVVKKSELNNLSNNSNRRQSRFKFQAVQIKQNIIKQKVSKMSSKRNSLQSMFEPEQFVGQYQSKFQFLIKQKRKISKIVSQLSMLQIDENNNIHQGENQKESSSRKNIEQQNKNTKQTTQMPLFGKLQNVCITETNIQKIKNKKPQYKQKQFNAIIRNNLSGQSILKHQKQATMYQINRQMPKQTKQLEKTPGFKKVKLIKCKGNGVSELPEICHYFSLKNDVLIQGTKNNDSEKQFQKFKTRQKNTYQKAASPSKKYTTPISQNAINQLRKLLLTKKNRNQILLYLSMIQATHQKYCGQGCIHIKNFYKDIMGDQKQNTEAIQTQILRVYRKNKA